MSHPSEEEKECEVCKRKLVWHEGVCAGWVHSNNFSENKKLSEKCKEIENAN